MLAKKFPKIFFQTSVERNLQKKNLKNKSMFRIVEVNPSRVGKVTKQPFQKGT